MQRGERETKRCRGECKSKRGREEGETLRSKEGRARWRGGEGVGDREERRGGCKEKRREAKREAKERDIREMKLHLMNFHLYFSIESLLTIAQFTLSADSQLYFLKIKNSMEE